MNLERLEGNAMSLFAIADPHLSLDADKSMEVFRGWQDYVARLEANWRAVVGEEDSCDRRRSFVGDVPRWSAAGYAVFAFSAGKKAFAKRQPRLLVVNAPKNGYLF